MADTLKQQEKVPKKQKVRMCSYECTDSRTQQLAAEWQRGISLSQACHNDMCVESYCIISRSTARDGFRGSEASDTVIDPLLLSSILIRTTYLPCLPPFAFVAYYLAPVQERGRGQLFFFWYRVYILPEPNIILGRRWLPFVSQLAPRCCLAASAGKEPVRYGCCCCCCCCSGINLCVPACVRGRLI